MPTCDNEEFSSKWFLIFWYSTFLLKYKTLNNPVFFLHQIKLLSSHDLQGDPTSAIILAYITLWANFPPWTVFTWTVRCHLLQKSLLHTSHWEIFLIIPHLLMRITNNYNFIIMFPIPSLSKPWEDIPLTQSFWTKFCPWLKLV